MTQAEESGEPDEDMPKLDRSQVVGDFGHTDFALLHHAAPQHTAEGLGRQGSRVESTVESRVE